MFCRPRVACLQGQSTARADHIVAVVPLKTMYSLLTNSVGLPAHGGTVEVGSTHFHAASLSALTTVQALDVRAVLLLRRGTTDTLSWQQSGG